MQFQVNLSSFGCLSDKIKLDNFVCYAVVMKTVHMLAAVVLLVSAAIGSYILATDSYLWSQAPTHADGLIAFTVLDVALVFGLWWKPRLATIGMTLLGLVQFGAMGADVFVGASTFGQSSSNAQSAFQTYLLGDTAFKTLLGVQVLIIVVGIAAFMMLRRSQKTSAPTPPATAASPMQQGKPA
jgi:hypothetical protein